MDEIIQIKESIAKLLSLRNIKSVIYVDEEFGSEIYIDKYIEYIYDNFNNEDFNLPFRYFKEAGVEAAITEFNRWWGNASEAERMESIESLHISIGNANQLKAILKSLLGEDIAQEYIHPTVFQSNVTEGKYTATEKKQLLVLMDYDLKGTGHTGLYYLRLFLNSKHVQCGLFSQTFTIDEEISKWNTECEHSSYIYPLSKSRVTEYDGKKLLDGIRNILWLRQISEIKKDYTRALKQATKNMSLFMDSFDPSTFNSIVLAKSENEGCWEFDTLNRVCNVKLNNELEKKVVKGRYFHSFQRKVGILRDIRTKVIDTMTTDTQLTKELVELERFEDTTFLNSTYSQICNGDIFRINNKIFMLLCQPCNLEIRKNGKRKAGDLLHIVPMFKQTKSLETARKELEGFQKEKEALYKEGRYEELANEAHNYNFKKAIPDDNNIENQYNSLIKYDDSLYLLRYNEAIMVDAWVLDLVSYNQDGELSLSIDKKVLKRYIMPNMQLRYDAIMNFLNKEEKPEDTKPYGFNGSCVKDLSISRIDRLKDPWAQEYLQEFMAYLSRPAYPMNLE